MPASTIADPPLSPHFRLSEFTLSQTAERAGLRNEPTGGARDNLQRLAQALEAVRATLRDAPILISSGYRSPSVNALVGGARDSAHMLGLAADFIAPSFGAPRLICQALLDAGTVFDQLILEGRWVHFGLAEGTQAPRRQVLTAAFRLGSPTVYMKGLV